MASLATMESASVIDGSIQRKMLGKRVVKAGKGINLVNLNSNFDDIIRIVKWLQKSGVLIDGVSEIWNNEIKQQKGWMISWYIIRKFRCFNVTKYVNWNRRKEL